MPDLASLNTPEMLKRAVFLWAVFSFWYHSSPHLMSCITVFKVYTATRTSQCYPFNAAKGFKGLPKVWG